MPWLTYFCCCCCCFLTRYYYYCNLISLLFPISFIFAFFSFFFFFLLLLNTCLKSLCLFFGCISGKKKTLSLCVCVLFDKINVAVKAILFFCCYCRSLSSSLHCTRFTAPSFCWHKHSFIIPFSLHHRCQLQHTHTHTQRDNLVLRSPSCITVPTWGFTNPQRLYRRGAPLELSCLSESFVWQSSCLCLPFGLFFFSPRFIIK